MRWKPTWLLVALALTLFAFIYFVERRISNSSMASPVAQHLLLIRPDEITRIEIERTNKVLLWAQKTNENWNLTLPIFYPAQGIAVGGLLQALAGLTADTYLTPREMAASHNPLANFGLDVPSATLTLFQGGTRSELLFGAKTAVGDQIYVQLLTKSGVYVVSSEIFDRLPRSANDWRNTAFVDLGGLEWDRMEVRAPSRGFAVQENPTNHTVSLSKPQGVRADVPRVKALLKQVQSAQVAQFITDDPRAELEPLGLQPPEAELAFGRGTNDVLLVQFGKSPTNDPSLVYARRLAQTNVVLVPKAVLDAVLTPHTELRDRHLLSFSPAELDTIEVIGQEKFTLRRQTNGVWAIGEPQTGVADAEVMREFIAYLQHLEGNVEKDVVTDFGIYALSQPARQYVLKSSASNATSFATNQILSQLDIGGVGGLSAEKIFVRRADENSVYWITRADLDYLPSAAWQLRDRQVWSFTTNQVTRVTVRHRGMTRQWERSPTSQWRFAPGSTGIIDDRQQLSLEETMFRLGGLRALLWVAKGEEDRSRYGFADDGYKMTIDLKAAQKTNSVSLEFGGLAPSNEGQLDVHYALAAIDGQSWIFEIPYSLHKEVVRDFGSPLARPAPSQVP